VITLNLGQGVADHAGERHHQNRPGADAVQEYVQVSAVGVPVSWSVDSTVPPSSDRDLLWQSRKPISPIVRLTDSSSLALLQNLLVIFAIVFGITASLVASLLVEWLRPRPRDRHDSQQPQPAPDQARHCYAFRTSAINTSGIDSRRWVAVAGTVILVAYMRSRLARRRYGSIPQLPTPER